MLVMLVAPSIAKTYKPNTPSSFLRFNLPPFVNEENSGIIQFYRISCHTLALVPFLWGSVE
jgi:hypothetical protein